MRTFTSVNIEGPGCDNQVNWLEGLTESAGAGSAELGPAVDGASASSSAASSSWQGDRSGQPPVPPPESSEPASKKPRSTIGALACCEVIGGYVSFYSKGVFEAVCKNQLHGSCVVSRSVSAIVDPNLGRPRGGRPLGVMLAWLAAHDCKTKSEHWAIEDFSFSQEERFVHRLGLQESEASKALLSHERKQIQDENVEPPDADLWEYMPRGQR